MAEDALNATRATVKESIVTSGGDVHLNISSNQSNKIIMLNNKL